LKNKENQMILKTAPNSGSAFPSKINLSYGAPPVQVFAFDDNGNAVVANWYLTDRDGRSASFGGSLNVQGPPAMLGNDPSAGTAPRVDFPTAYLPISGPSVTYFPPAASYNAQAVKAKLVATANGITRELLIDINSLLSG
jgi:hypothetical protein